VLFNNTLYSYTSSAFQSLTLDTGAKWIPLDTGESVTNGVCVGTSSGLFIVGGTSSNSSYQGLQKYTYATGKWESITPPVHVTQSRVYHSAVYLPDSDLILVYAGSQDGNNGLSTQTYTIGASAPYDVLSYESNGAPPTTAPILLQWSSSTAVMIGGDSTNTKVYLFTPCPTSRCWYDSNSTLSTGITKGSSLVKGALMSGDDGSKQLYTFDPSVSPNAVERIMLWSGSGAAVANSAPLRRDLDASNWPSYNSSGAPTATRGDYSLAYDSTGMVVLSGGNSDSILDVFDARQNSWDNATSMLTGVNVKSDSESTSSVTASSTITSATSSTSVTSATSSISGTSSSVTTSTAAAASTTAAAATNTATELVSTGMKPTTILGIALGCIFGCAFLLIALLCCLRRKKQKKLYIDAGRARRASGMPEQPPPDYLAADMGKATGGFIPGHSQQDSQSSFSSMAILMGKTQKPAINRKPSKSSKRSSAGSMLNKQFKSTIGRPSPIPEPEIEYADAYPEKPPIIPPPAAPTRVQPRAAPDPTRDDGVRRSSGWNRYWSAGSTLNALGFGSGGPQQRDTQVSSSSNYTDMHRMTQDSATVPPLHVDEPKPSFHSVNSASPTVSFFANEIREGQSVEIERPVSTSNSSSGYSSGIPPSVHDSWDPTSAKKSWGPLRAPSSIYSQSIYPTALGTPGNLSRPPTGVSQQPQLAKASTSTDMSWLNLGESGQNGRC
jgi:uncharacterized membrane protein